MMENIVRHLLLFALVIALSSCTSATPPPAEPDAAALLKQAYSLHEKIRPEAREHTKLQLVMAEYSFGDRELGRKLLAEVLIAAKNEPDLASRFELYGAVIAAQQAAGLTDEARSTIQAAQAVERGASEKDLTVEPIMNYGRQVIDFYASVGEVDEALRFIDASRFPQRTTPEETEFSVKYSRAQSRMKLVDALLNHDRNEQAEQVLRWTLVEYPGTHSEQLAKYWIRLRKPAEARRAIESCGQASIAPAALASIDVGDPAEARRLLALLQSSTSVYETRWDEFQIYAKLGEYDKAIAAADRPIIEENPELVESTVRFHRNNRKRHFALLAFRTAKTGRRDLSEIYIAEVEKLIAADKEIPYPGMNEDEVMLLGIARLIAGDATALLKVAEKSDNPITKFNATIMTAAQRHSHQTGEKPNAYWSLSGLE